MLVVSPHISESYLIKQLPCNIVFINKKFEVVLVSNRWAEIFNKKESNIIGQNIFQLFPELSVKWQEVLIDCFNGGQKPLGVHKFTSAINNERFFEWSASCWFDAKEDSKGAMINVEDVTDKLTTEIELQKKEFILNQQSELTKIGRWEYEVEDNKLTWCTTTKSIHEFAPHYIPNIDSAISFYKEGHSRNAISMAFYEATNKGIPWNLRLQIITAKGNEKWVLATGKPIFANRKIIGLIGTIQDIDEQVNKELKIKENEKLLKTLIDNLPLNIYIKDTESKKILVNKSECDFLGVTDPKELLGKDDFDFYNKQSAIASRSEDLEVMNSLKPILSKETTMLKKDGEETAFLTSKIPLTNEDGEIYGLVGISLDITNLKQKEKELRNLINVISLQNKKLFNFAHIVSHNLRSHSANFSMLLNFLVEEKCEDEKKRIMDMLLDASSKLLDTLNDLNEVVAINSKINLDKKKINLHKKVNDVQKNLSGFIINKKAKIINNIPKDTLIKSVPSYLENILINLITNAIKYKHIDRQPIITFSIDKTPKYSILNVQDNGSGIDLKKHGNKLFGMYKTFHNMPDSKGIGLYITKNQIEAMNGRIEVQSIVDKGSTFKIFFDAKN